MNGQSMRLPMRHDYVGSNVNKAARPFGIVLDRADFPNAKDTREPMFYSQTRRLSGLNEVEVWVTNDIFTQLVPRERLRETPEVRVAGLCVTQTSRGLKILLARRADDRRLFPGKIEGCGGQLRISETFSEGVARHFRLEMRMEVNVLEEFHCFYAIQEPGMYTIPGIRFLCEPVTDAEPTSLNHSKVWWESESQFKKIDADEFVGNLKQEALTLIREHKARRKARRKPKK